MNAEQRERMKKIGRAAFVREEMARLGYWPPDTRIAQREASAEAQLRELYDVLGRMRTDLTRVEAEIAESGDLPKLLAEVRHRRIERVRDERARKKVERAAEKARKAESDSTWRRTTLPFLGRGVSAGLHYTGGDPAKAAGLGLPPLESASDVAWAIGVPERDLAWLAYHRQASGSDHYARFVIPKKKGGVRVISSPKRRLRVAQLWLLKNVLEHLPVHDAAQAFRPGRSVRDNAAPHTGQAVIVKVDFKDFFPSLTLPRVKRLFQSLGYNEGVSTLFGLIATETPRVAVLLDGKRRFAAVGPRALPQGACTSPAITNLLCRRLDARLTGAAAALGFRYTRYADDLTFSHERAEAPVGLLLTLVRRIIADEELVVNESKTVVLRPQDRQVVTGLVVNGAVSSAGATPRLSREDLRRFRSFLHHCETEGLEAVSARQGRDALAYATGYLSFIHMVRPDRAAEIAARHPWVVRRG